MWSTQRGQNRLNLKGQIGSPSLNSWSFLRIADKSTVDGNLVRRRWLTCN